ncbi:HbrB-like-domain-containing protein [Gigaspora rosea]|uniref:HbrB-like-domain-containing protein n=2 Tax=Gigasporaceae TaxID=36753 RepID=A0A397UXK2_9GLOM|nr:HbrB-like-domain-containing protein [Gigaspora rosea]
MSLNPIQEMGESPHSTPAYNSLSTSSTSSTSSLSHHHQAPISTSLPSFSSSVSTYIGPIIQAGGTVTTSTPMSTDTNGTWSSQSSQQQRQMPQVSQLSATYRSQPSFSNRSGLTSSSSSATSSILNVTSSPSSLVPLIPSMERSNSASTMYTVSSAGGHFHEKSNSTGSISVNLKDSASTNQLPYIPPSSHRSPVHDNMASIFAKELERLEHSDDKWASLGAKVLPLFNGLGLKAYIEDLNELVRCCIKDRSPQLLRDDINSLLLTGMSTLNGKLRGVPDEKLVSRLVEIWSFYFGTVLPYFEGVFLPLQMQATAQHQRDNMNVRRLVLMSFRDHVILPIGDRVEDAFNKLFHDFDSGIPVTDTAARMLQMSYILSSILSDDDKQKDMDRILGKLKNNWKLFMRRRDRRGFVGMSPSNPSNVQAVKEATVGNVVSNTANSMNGIPTTSSPAL